MSTSVVIELPHNLCVLAGVNRLVEVPIDGTVSLRSVLDALEAEFPVLRGTIRDHSSGLRRPFLRFFACEQDLSHISLDDPLPDSVTKGAEPLLILGAIAGG